MKIAMLAPVWERVPPVRYGGIELVVSLLSDELARRGYDVTLFASGDSVTAAKRSCVYPTAVRAEMGRPEPDLLHVATAYHRSMDMGVDIVHNHAGYSGVAFASFATMPVLTTLHGGFTDLNLPFFRAFKDSVYYSSVSDEQRRPCPDLNYMATIYNAIDVDSYPFTAEKKDFFVTIGRVTALKGTAVAVEVAKKAGVKLLLAGKIDPGRDMRYFTEKVEPGIDGRQIRWLGEVSEEEKRQLYRDAKGFIFPLQWREPFGLVMVEAMATGTPVIAFPYGAVPEIVADGKTGFLVDTVDEMAEAVRKVDQIDQYECRRHVEEHFSVRRMTDDYLALYEEIVKKGKPRPGNWGR